MGDIEDYDMGSNSSEWSWEENKLFELALASIDEGTSERWKEVASMLGGNKSAEEVQKHYEALLEDLDSIESGSLDHEICNQSILVTNEDQILFAQLTIK